MKIDVQLEWTRPIWNKGTHSAFTDFCEFRNGKYLCFREADTHVSGNGKIRILALNEENEVISNNLLQLPNVDLRDPKLSVTPENKLLLIGYARYVEENGNTRFSQCKRWFSTDGHSWSAPKDIGYKGWWLWRVSWIGNQALGFAYNRRAQCLKLFKGNPGRTFDCINPEALSLAKHKKGYPNESDIIFDNTGTAYALVRRDADSCSSQLGISQAPYKKWSWYDLKYYIGGPSLLKIDEKVALAAGRIWLETGPKTALYVLDLHQKTLTPVLLLPSEGDSSYPGMIKKNGSIYISYYSSHIGGKSAIYLAKLALKR